MVNRSSVARSSLAWALAFGVAVACAIWYWRGQGLRELAPDDGIYQYVAWAWTQGDVPYRAAWDHKGPFIYAVPALRIALFGNSPEIIGAQEIVLGLAAALMLAVIATQLWGAFAGATALALGSLVWAQFTPSDNFINTGNSLLSVTTVCAALCAVQLARHETRHRAPWLIAFGLVQGMLLCSKPNAVVSAALVVPAILGRPRGEWWRSGLLIAAGASLPVAGFVLLFAHYGALGDLVDAYVRFNTHRGADFLVGLGPANLARRLVELLRAGRVAWTLGALIVAAAWQLRLRWSGRLIDPRDRLAAVLVPLWALLSLVELASNGGFRAHLYGALPPIVLGGVWVIVVSGRLTFVPERARAWVKFATLTAVAMPLVVAVVNRPPHSATPQPWRLLGADLARAAEPGERVLTFLGWTGAPTLLTANRLSAERFVHPSGLYLRGYASDRQWREILATVEAPHPVRFVLTDALGAPSVDPPTVAWALSNLDRPLFPAIAADTTPFPSRERVRRALEADFQVVKCYGPFCLLRRVAPTSAVATRAIADPTSRRD